MCKNVLKIMMATLFMALSASFVNAQVHVGDIFAKVIVWSVPPFLVRKTMVQ